MEKFSVKQITDTKLDTYINLGLNVLIIGEKGTGKSQRIIDAFERNKLKYAYFSGATIDPFLHLIGVPNSVEDNGKQVLDFILPKNIDDNLEAIFLDEANRTHKMVRNALMELIQFKSINGRKFPKLKCVFAAINPTSDKENNSTYDVEEMDEAQWDRFHIVLEVPNDPDVKYFINKYGNFKGQILTDWWKEQSKQAKKTISPRRLSYIGDLFDKGVDITDMLPVCANSKSLIKLLSTDEETFKINKILESPNDSNMKNLLSNTDLYMKYKSKIVNKKYFKYLHYVDDENLSQLIEENQDFKKYALQKFLEDNKKYNDIITEISKISEDNKYKKLIIAKRSTKILKNSYTIPDLPLLKNDGKKSPYSFLIYKDYLGNHPMSLVFNKINNDTCKKDEIIISMPLDTHDKKELFSHLTSCYNTINIYVAVTFILSVYLRSQKNTLLSMGNFESLMFEILKRAKKELKVEEQEKIYKLLYSSRRKDKIKNHFLFEKMMKENIIDINEYL